MRWYITIKCQNGFYAWYNDEHARYKTIPFIAWIPSNCITGSLPIHTSASSFWHLKWVNTKWIIDCCVVYHTNRSIFQSCAAIELSYVSWQKTLCECWCGWLRKIHTNFLNRIQIINIKFQYIQMTFGKGACMRACVRVYSSIYTRPIDV